jgi:hypothetical protein
MCDDQARPQASPRYGSATHPTRVEAAFDVALTHPVTATAIIVMRIAVGMLWVAVRCTGRYTRSMSGSVAKAAQRATGFHPAGRLRPHAIAAPARAWPIGLGIDA